MSGIYIPGMEMPDICYECFVRNWGYSGDGMKCHMTGSVTSWHDGCLKRMDNVLSSPSPTTGGNLRSGRSTCCHICRDKKRAEGLRRYHQAVARMRAMFPGEFEA